MQHKFLLSFIFIAFCLNGFSQNSAFAITGQAAGNMNWTDIRSIDMASGNINSVLFENGKTKYLFEDAETNQKVDEVFLRTLVNNIPKVAGQEINVNNPSPTFFMSAAIAYDKKHDKLFFASMHTGQLVA